MSIFPRESGILLHPTSLPGNLGIGDFGEAAYRFVDWLQHGGQSLWQVMPLGPAGFGDSPYSALSAFAGNPLMVSLEVLMGDGLVQAEDLTGAPTDDPTHVDWGTVRPWRDGVLRLAWSRLSASKALQAEYDAFVADPPHWLHDFSLFITLKDHFGGGWWLDWPEDIRKRQPDAVKHWQEELANEIAYQCFVQFLFLRQWNSLRAYANERGIRIIGDIPIFVALDSADVWSNQSDFNFDRESGQPTFVAGVPPDFFSATGQRWGNPTYDWKTMKASGYRWWVMRLGAMRDMFDIVRIDHFRGFAAAWHVPNADDTAANGHWELAPGAEVFATARRELGEFPVIVEDLGIITGDVIALRTLLNFPGMNVLQFAFDGDSHNAYLPHNHLRNSVTYTATHDNQTTLGWWESLSEEQRDVVRHYLGIPVNDPAWDLLRVSLASAANTSIAPMQDILRLNDAARMNTPATTFGNWSWRMTWDQLDGSLADGLRDLTTTFGRLPGDEPQRGENPFDYTQINGSVQAIRTW